MQQTNEKTMCSSHNMNIGIKHDFPFINIHKGMLMKDKIIFDCYFCIKCTQMKEIMAHYILQPDHIFICVKTFILMLVLGGVQLLIISMPW